MTDTLRILGQIIPTINVLTTLYTVPSATMTSVSSIVVCSQNNAGSSFNISVAINGAADAPQQYIFYQAPIDINDSLIATIGISLAAGDQIRCLSSTGNISFSAFGVEVT